MSFPFDLCYSFIVYGDLHKMVGVANDDKRVVMSDGINTLAIGHRATRGDEGER